MKKKLLALLLTLAMVVSLAACGGGNSGSSGSSGGDANTNTSGDTQQPSEGDTQPSGGAESTLPVGYDPTTGTENYGPHYDEWSEMTDDQLYEMALQEVADGHKEINIYATSSKMMKEEEPFEAAYPGLDVIVHDLDSDEVLSKAKTENQTGNITGDVLQTKDVNGDVFFEWYHQNIIEPFYPKDICEHINPENLKYSFPLYASQSYWYYNTEMYPDGQPITSWWQIIERDESGNQKFKLFTKEIGQETAYLSLFASFISHADEMEKAYKDLYGKDLEYTYDPSGFSFAVPENNAGVEYLWRFTQCDMTFIGDGDELVQAVHNSADTNTPTLALASAGKIENREESKYNIDWCINLTPYTALLNTESLFVVSGCDNPAGARLFIRYLVGGADGESGGLKPFTKVGNWPLRDDVEDKKNPATLDELGAIPNNLDDIYAIFLDVQDMWLKWKLG